STLLPNNFEFNSRYQLHVQIHSSSATCADYSTHHARKTLFRAHRCQIAELLVSTAANVLACQQETQE
ncbi:hypothetical protein ACC848_39430, partial [Rhizobium johnstonii]